MKNLLICKNCGTENSFYKFNCTKCKAILRERIVNIDLWHTLNLLIDTPGRAFQSIIHAEHKNFIVFLGSLLILKIFINSVVISEQLYDTSDSALLFLLLAFFVVPVFLITAAYKMKFSLKIFRIDTRFKDDYSVLTYSFIPYIYALVFLFPVEITLFGGYLFSNNPSPFELKLIPAYILCGLEVLMALWSIVLLFSAVKVNSKSNLYSLIFSLLAGLAFFSLPLLMALLLHVT